MADYTRYQKKTIERYYDRRDEIMLNKLGDIVTELYLEESEAKLSRLWTRAKQAMTALKVSPKIANRIIEQRDPEVLARNLRGWLEASKKSSHGEGKS